ncbi:MAG: right-handed parallel beta-helix repeat-containing protein, partial [Thermoplasmata archaeon]
VRDSNLANSTIDGTWAAGCSSVQIDANTATGSRVGAEIDLSNSVAVEANNYSRSGTGIVESNVTGSIIQRNNLSNSHVGLHVENSTDVSSSYDYASHAGVAVEAYSDTFLNLSDERFPRSTAIGVLVEGTDHLTVNVSTITDCGGTAIEIGNSSDVLVGSDDVSSYGGTGVAVSDSSSVAIMATTAEPATGSIGPAFSTSQDENLTLSQDTATGARFGEHDEGSSGLVVTGNDFASSNVSGAGLYLSLDREVKVVDNQLSDAAAYGIESNLTKGLSIVRNTLSRVESVAIGLNGSSDVNVSFNKVDNATGYALYLVDVSLFTVGWDDAGNGSTVKGIGFYGDGLSSGAVTDNQFDRTNVSLALVGCNGVEVDGNNASLSTYGMQLTSNVNVTVADNEFLDDRYSFEIEANTGTWIYHNNFEDDSSWRNDPSVQLIHWTAGYPEGGNFWSNHTSPDSASGPNQTTPGPDGIVDTPFVLNVTNVDRYPLAVPWVPNWINFTETGITVGYWGVQVNGVTFMTDFKWLVCEQAGGPNSTFQFTVILPPGFNTSFPSSGGPILESRTNYNYLIQFIPKYYVLTVQEYGLAPGTSWGLVVGSTLFNTMNSTIDVKLPNGPFSYIAGKVAGYTLYDGGGAVLMDNGSQSVTVFYLPIPTSAPPSTAPGSAFSNVLGYGLVAGVVVLGIAAAAMTALWLRARKTSARPDR